MTFKTTSNTSPPSSPSPPSPSILLPLPLGPSSQSPLLPHTFFPPFFLPHNLFCPLFFLTRFPLTLPHLTFLSSFLLPPFSHCPSLHVSLTYITYCRPILPTWLGVARPINLIDSSDIYCVAFLSARRKCNESFLGNMTSHARSAYVQCLCVQTDTKWCRYLIQFILVGITHTEIAMQIIL